MITTKLEEPQPGPLPPQPGPPPPGPPQPGPPLRLIDFSILDGSRAEIPEPTTAEQTASEHEARERAAAEIEEMAVQTGKQLYAWETEVETVRQRMADLERKVAKGDSTEDERLDLAGAQETLVALEASVRTGRELQQAQAELAAEAAAIKEVSRLREAARQHAKAQALCRAAIRKHESGDCKGALGLLEEAIGLDPQTSNYLLRAGDMHLKLGAPEMALAMYERCQKLLLSPYQSTRLDQKLTLSRAAALGGMIGSEVLCRQDARRDELQELAKVESVEDEEPKTHAAPASIADQIADLIAATTQHVQVERSAMARHQSILMMAAALVLAADDDEPPTPPPRSGRPPPPSAPPRSGHNGAAPATDPATEPAAVPEAPSGIQTWLESSSAAILAASSFLARGLAANISPEPSEPLANLSSLSCDGCHSALLLDEIVHSNSDFNLDYCRACYARLPVDMRESLFVKPVNQRCGVWFHPSTEQAMEAEIAMEAELNAASNAAPYSTDQPDKPGFPDWSRLLFPSLLETFEEDSKEHAEIIKGVMRAKPTREQTPAQAALEAAQAEEQAAMEAMARAKAARERARQMALEAEEEERRAERALREQQQAKQERERAAAEAAEKQQAAAQEAACVAAAERRRLEVEAMQAAAAKKAAEMREAAEAELAAELAAEEAEEEARAQAQAQAALEAEAASQAEALAKTKAAAAKAATEAAAEVDALAQEIDALATEARTAAALPAIALPAIALPADAEDDELLDLDNPAPIICGALGPAWTRGELERPVGTKDMGGWTAAVYTEEQQARLGVNEDGTKRDVELQ